MFRPKQPTMKEILFPQREIIKMNFEHHKRNLRFIKDLEKANKEVKVLEEELEKQKNLEFDDLNNNNNNNENNNNENNNENNNINNEPEHYYKMKMFENIPSRYWKDTENWILKQNKITLSPLKKNLFHPNKKQFKSKLLLNDFSYKNNNKKTLNIENNNYESLFEKYYGKKLNKNSLSGSYPNLFNSQPIISNINPNGRKSNKIKLPPINIF